MAFDPRTQAANDALELLSQPRACAATPPIDPKLVARLCGARVKELSDLDMKVSGAFIHSSDPDPVIVVNKRQSEERRRFTCAHELGHFLRAMQLGIVRGHVEYKKAMPANFGDPEEIYANEFAACLLMPNHMISALHEQGLNTLEMAHTFVVSFEAMKFRLQRLGVPAG
jgi:Zn-dependent peptidase ImmA (M78 family)